MPLLHINGVETHYHLQGRGRALVLLHPPCMGSRVFTYLRNDLAQDHRVLAFDFRGHGRSASSRERITIPVLAEDVRLLLDELELSQAYLVSYSSASLVALEAMLAYPDRFRGAAMLSGVSELTDRRRRLEAQAMKLAASFKAKELLALAGGWRHADNAEAFHRLRAETKAGDPDKWKEYLSACLDCRATERLGRIGKPALLLFGENDRKAAPDAKMLQRGLGRASTAWIPGADERLPIHSSGACAQLIRDWIAALEEGPRPVAARIGEDGFRSETYGIGFDPDEPADEEDNSTFKDYR
ncbi:alpha/beta fold hydrolase [Cohnella fermenti]|uniref:alpha/beta fold hydrolase n=1 Tax=Cohnella fermenti TaxID=2565925 RepID=UPI001454C287|nr:alpha/beta hydrolase [Cohnella fermenti]